MQETATIVAIVEISDGYFHIAMMIARIKTVPLKRSLPLLIFFSPLYPRIIQSMTCPPRHPAQTATFTVLPLPKTTPIHAAEQVFFNQSGNVSYVSLITV